MIEQWVMVGDPGPVEDRDTFHRYADRRRIARGMAWLLYAATQWAHTMLMWVLVQRLELDGQRPALVIPAPVRVSVPAVRWLRTWAVCAPHNGPNVGGFGTRRPGVLLT